MRKLLADIEADGIDCVLVYKVDRLSRSLQDFARLMEIFERRKVSLVSVTQPPNTTGSLGRLTLNILLSFAEFEQMIADRTRDKVGAAPRKGKWVGGMPVLGYDIAASGGKLLVNAESASGPIDLCIVSAAFIGGFGARRDSGSPLDDEAVDRS